MLEVSQVLECKQLRVQGRSIRAIAKSLGVSRNTVRGYLRGARRPGEYSLGSGRSSPVSDALSTRVQALLLAEQAAQTPRKQRLTAARIGRLLAGEGLLASESTVRSVVRLARLDVRDPLQHAYVPLHYEPGIDAQVDFFEGVVDDVEHGRVKVFILLVRACYSTPRSAASRISACWKCHANASAPACWKARPSSARIAWAQAPCAQPPR